MKSYKTILVILVLCVCEYAHTTRWPKRSSIPEPVNLGEQTISSNIIPTSSKILRDRGMQTDESVPAKIENVCGFLVHTNCQTNRDAQRNILTLLRAINAAQQDYDIEVINRYHERLALLIEYADAPQISETQKAYEAKIIEIAATRVPSRIRHIMSGATHESDQK